MKISRFACKKEISQMHEIFLLNRYGSVNFFEIQFVSEIYTAKRDLGFRASTFCSCKNIFILTYHRVEKYTKYNTNLCDSKSSESKIIFFFFKWLSTCVRSNLVCFLPKKPIRIFRFYFTFISSWLMLTFFKKLLISIKIYF